MGPTTSQFHIPAESVKLLLGLLLNSPTTAYASSQDTCEIEIWVAYSPPNVPGGQSSSGPVTITGPTPYGEVCVVAGTVVVGTEVDVSGAGVVVEEEVVIVVAVLDSCAVFVVLMGSVVATVLVVDVLSAVVLWSWDETVDVTVTVRDAAPHPASTKTVVPIIDSCLRRISGFPSSVERAYCQAVPCWEQGG